MEPFCLATPRQLSYDHPVRLLLQPHTRYTLATNNAAYNYFVDRRRIYFKFYAGTLEESRQILIDSHREKRFMDLELEAELSARGVSAQPHHYPYRDDLRLWRSPIREFVHEYLCAFYSRDESVQYDAEIQAWARELMSPDCGALVGLVPDERLDTVDKLVDLLAQVLFVAGPGHAAQHYSEMYYCSLRTRFSAGRLHPAAGGKTSEPTRHASAARFRLSGRPASSSPIVNSATSDSIRLATIHAIPFLGCARLSSPSKSSKQTCDRWSARFNRGSTIAH